MNKPIIIAFVGLSFTGKSTARGLTEQMLDERGLGWHKSYFGGIVVGEVERRNEAHEWAPEQVHLSQEKKERHIRERLREEHGLGAMAKLSIPDIDSALADGRIVLIDDLYSEEEREILVDKYGENNLALVALAADWDVRVRRAKHRPHRPLDEAELAERDDAEIHNLHKAPPIARAHFTMVNNANERTDHAAALASLRRELESRVLPHIL